MCFLGEMFFVTDTEMTDLWMVAGAFECFNVQEPENEIHIWFLCVVHIQILHFKIWLQVQIHRRHNAK